VSVQDRCTVCAKHTIVIEIVFDALDGTPRFEVKWKLISACLEIVLIFNQDRCMVWAESTIGLLDCTPR
jgi:hypothetical protein